MLANFGVFVSYALVYEIEPMTVTTRLVGSPIEAHSQTEHTDLPHSEHLGIEANTAEAH